MNPELTDVAKTLMEMGANVNAYRPGRFVLIVYFDFCPRFVFVISSKFLDKLYTLLHGLSLYD